MVALVYSTIGFLFSVIIAEFFYIPPDFRWGFLVLGWTSNWGNLSNAIVETVAKQSPFAGDVDRDLGIAYSAVFVLVLQITFYGFGVYKICSWDFKEDRRDTTPQTLKAKFAQRKQQVHSLWRHKSNHPVLGDAQVANIEAAESKDNIEGDDLPSLGAHVGERMGQEQHRPMWRRVLRGTGSFLLGCISPVSITIPLAILIALVNPLKSLFIPVEGWTDMRIGSAPDHSPPLSFIYEFTTFVGGMAIPAGLFQLGTSFSRLKLPRPLSKLPIAAITASVIAKYALRPVVGVFMVQGLRKHTDLFPVTDKMLSFTAYLLSGTPSGVTQMSATQLFVPDGKSPDTLAAFMGAQYAFLLIGSSAQTAISLWLVS